MKSFALINNHKQWKVSYGEYTFWKLCARWFVDYGSSLLLVRDGELRNELEERLLKVKYGTSNYCDGN